MTPSFYYVCLIVLCTCSTFEASDVYYHIKPSMNASCPEEPCLTLSQFATHTEDYLESNTTLFFLPGQHNLSLEINITTITKLSMTSKSTISNSPSATIACEGNASFNFFSINTVYIGHLRFSGCYGHKSISVQMLVVVNSLFLSHRGPALEIISSLAKIAGSSFIANSHGSYQQRPTKFNDVRGGAALYIKNVNITLISSVFEENRASGDGGVIRAERDNRITITHSNFSRNSAVSGGVLSIESRDMNLVNIIGCEFIANSAEKTGGVIIIDAIQNLNNIIKITIKNTKFIRNKARFRGGALQLNSVKMTLYESVFAENSAQYYGGIVFATHTNLTVFRGMIRTNSVRTGIIYTAEDSTINFYNTTIKDNIATIGTLSFFQSIAVFSNVTLSDNIGSVLIVSSNMTFIGGVITNCSTSQNTNGTMIPDIESDEEIYGIVLATYEEGGALTMFQSTIAFKGICSLIRNQAKIGGAIHATESKVYVYDETTIAHNRASESGGGVYMYRSELNCYVDDCYIKIINNTCVSKGGGVYTISSTISTPDTGMINFKGNYAKDAGGGMCVELNSKLYIYTNQPYNYRKFRVQFEYNSANYGGAVYIADETTASTCASESYQIQSITTECFIQILSLRKISWNDGINVPALNFVNNNASISGSNLFGGLLDRCTISPFVDKEIVLNMIPDGVRFLKIISRNIRNLDSITSNPVRLCFCNKSRQPDCSYQPPFVRTEKGKLFTVTLVAVDQVNNTIPNVTIRSSLSSSSGGLGENQLNQSTGESCSDLRFEIFSPYESEQLILYADGPCKDAPMSQRRVGIQFTPCTCPLGFQVNVAEKTKCDCECNLDLLPYVTKCDPKTETIVRETNFWMDYIGGYLVYPHCPLDYCKPSEDEVKINLNVENGVDIQCANHRTGLLCGTCLSNYSLSLGSSQCIQCPSNWPTFTVILILASTVAGVLFVALLLLLNLTVAVGTLNGIIFYANVVAANSNAVFPSNMFISWLNLEVGFNICFFKGMDAYWKTWLQLAFPTYLIFLVVMVIIISKRSARFTRLIGRRDPVATLATLVLLSYTKLLHAIIASLSGTVLKYPELNHTREEVVWLPDASIKYLSGKHIPLFIVAVLILLAGIFYTTILFLWQWILQLKMFRWLSRTQKLSLFIQTYHVPYVPQHRYWTGLLLVARIVLYIVSSANVEGDPKINLTAIGVVVLSTIILKDFLEYRGRIYHRKSIEMLETACHFNLVILCTATFLTLEHEKVSAVIFHVSVSFTAALLLAVLLYHLLTEVIFKTKMWRNYKEHQHRPIVTDDAPANRQNTKIRSPTYSIVEIPKQSSQDISNKKEFENVMSEFDGELKVILLDGNEQYH